jgi:hypothetical protein
LKLKFLEKNEVVDCQKRGYFDEHLATLYSVAYGDPYICHNKYLLYHDSSSEIVWLTLFGLDSQNNNCKDASEYFENVIQVFQPNEIVTTSPKPLPSNLGYFHSEIVYEDKDYQINLRQFDEKLKGGEYKHVRYRVKNAEKRNYKLNIGKELTIAHSHIVATHMIKTKYNVWDYQLYLNLGNYLSRFSSPKLFNVFLDNTLIGFDVIDFLSDIISIPLGFYLDYQSLADFILYQEILLGKSQGFEWLDVGWTCHNSGLEAFKKKWNAIPRFNVYMQHYYDVRGHKQS